MTSALGEVQGNCKLPRKESTLFPIQLVQAVNCKCSGTVGRRGPCPSLGLRTGPQDVILEGYGMDVDRACALKSVESTAISWLSPAGSQIGFPKLSFCILMDCDLLPELRTWQVTPRREE